jgi:nanoRNase/pAp phosphatase (c-di-AMP/oligoRNAs hydrolase)
LITSCEKITDLLLIHPQDITDKQVEITSRDILANLPYHPKCGKWFDHHLLTASNETPPAQFDGRYGLAPSAASMVYEYYLPQNPHLTEYEALLSATERLDSAQLNIDDILNPKDYILLGLTLDPRTGLGDYQDYFRILLHELKHKTIAEVVQHPAVRERVERMRAQDAHFREVTRAHSTQDGNVVFTDFRSVQPVPIGNRFLVYTLFPQANISLRAHWGPRRERVAVTVGHSIFNRTSRTNIGMLMSQYGGGGHRGAGTCLVSAAKADQQIAEMIAVMKKDG